MGFAFCNAYLAFLIIYFREYENKQELKQYSTLREMQVQSMQKEIEQVKISSQKLAILRHDMRHHFLQLSSMAERNTIPFHVQIDLPAQISVDETDFCLVLSNLLENALEASLKTAKFRQRIDIKIYRHASNLILIQIENAFDGKIQQNHGIFLSSKRNQNGIGIQSVRHIVEKTGGGCDFTYDNGIFTAKIMLRPCINA